MQLCKKIDIIEPDPDAKPEISEYEYFDSRKFEKSEPELYAQYLQELLFTSISSNKI